MRRAGLVAVLLALLGASVVGASPASAGVGTPTRPNAAFKADGTLTDGAIAYLRNPSAYPPPATGDTLAPTDIDPTITRARVNGGALPKMSDVATGGASSGGGIAANTKIALKSTLWALATTTAITGYLDAYHLIRGDYGTTAVTTGTAGYVWRFQGLRYEYYTAGQALASPLSTATATAPVTGWYYVANECDGTSTCTPNMTWQGWPSVAPPGESVLPDLWAAWRSSAGALGSLMTSVRACGTCNAWFLVASDSDIERVTTRDTTTKTGYDNAADRVTRTFTQPTFNSTAAAATYGTPGSQTDAQKGAENALAAAVAGTSGGTSGGTTGTTGPTFAPFVLPRPNVGETYPDYTQRLRDEGWLGTLTLSDDATSYTAGSPAAQLAGGAVTGVTVGTSTADRFSIPAGLPGWPDNPPTVSAADTPITVRKIPGTPADSASSCPCTVRPIDLSPLTGLSLGTKFPFGVFGWLTSAVGTFDVSPVTPEVDWPVHLGVTSVHTFSDQDFHVKLDAYDGYMVVIRGIETFFLWASAIWFVGAKFLKLDWAGQPSDGLDEVL